MLWSSNRAVPARPRRRGPRRRARVRGADLAVEFREQVGVALLVQLAPVDELPRAWETEERGNIKVDQCQFAVVKHGIFGGGCHVEGVQVLDARFAHDRCRAFCEARDLCGHHGVVATQGTNS